MYVCMSAQGMDEWTYFLGALPAGIARSNHISDVKHGKATEKCNVASW